MKISSASSTAIHGIRLLCAQAVLVGHAMVFFGLYPKNIPYIQSIAVTGLFILSGFLTVYSYENKKGKTLNIDSRIFLLTGFQEYILLIYLRLFLLLCLIGL